MRRHGQATVELALGALVMVTVVLMGIHLSEVGYLSLKVQEAAAFATWEATGRRVQSLRDNNADPFDAIITGASAVDTVAQNAYRDFNGLSSVDTGSATVIKGLTRGSGLQVACEENTSLSFPPTATASAVYFDRGGMSCNAEARLEIAHFGADFLNAADGFFKARQHDGRGAAAGGRMRVCAVGRATAGACNRTLSVLLNDWALQGDAEKGECRLGVDAPGACNAVPMGAPLSGPNTIYKQSVARMWAAGWTYSVDLATRYAGSAPASPNEYWFSFAGRESDYNTTNGGEGRGTWNTGGPGAPGSNVPHSVQRDCFLGRSTLAGVCR